MAGDRLRTGYYPLLQTLRHTANLQAYTLHTIGYCYRALIIFIYQIYNYFNHCIFFLRVTNSNH